MEKKKAALYTRGRACVVYEPEGVLELTAQNELSFVYQMDGEEEGCSIYQREGLCCLYT